MRRFTLLAAMLAVGLGIVAARAAMAPIGEGFGSIDEAEWYGYGIGA